MKVKISAAPKYDIDMSNMKMDTLYMIMENSVDHSYPLGALVCKDEYGHAIIFDHNQGQVYSFSSPTFKAGIKLALYTKPLVLEN
jgi:molybdopterin/thiamine biosynthesis adenylyltransferase